MNEVDAMATYWAVLIGINFYEKPLKGCVRDMESIKQYLEAGSTPVCCTQRFFPAKVMNGLMVARQPVLGHRGKEFLYIVHILDQTQNVIRRSTADLSFRILQRVITSFL
jgi:hypothetical protein